jgi:hypothetical protein
MILRKRGRRWSVEVYDPAKASRKWYVGTFDSEREAKEAGRSARPRLPAGGDTAGMRRSPDGQLAG